MGDAAAEMLAKEMQAIVAADRWKNHDLSTTPPEKWSHLRPETQQFWIDTAARILAALPAASSEGARSANRVSYNDDGTLDEIVTDAGVHLEDLGGNRWFLGAARSDGTEIRVWFRGKVTLIEDDAKEAKP